MTLYLEEVVGGRGIKASLEHPWPTQPHGWRRFSSPTAQKRLIRSKSCLSAFDSTGGMSAYVFAAESVQKIPQHESVVRLSFMPLDPQEHALNMWPPSSWLTCTTKSLTHFKHVKSFLACLQSWSQKATEGLSLWKTSSWLANYRTILSSPLPEEVNYKVI